MKKCYRCKQEKELSNFYKDKTRKNGYSNRCISCDKEHTQQYHKKHQSKYNKNKYKHINKFPERQSARVLVRNALERGDLVRKSCEVCQGEKVHAHHDDYTKPLIIRWLCYKHHSEWHTSNTPIYEK